eukprot:3806299-Pyramimonas_sp.AAC.1
MDRYFEHRPALQWSTFGHATLKPTRPVFSTSRLSLHPCKYIGKPSSASSNSPTLTSILGLGPVEEAPVATVGGSTAGRSEDDDALGCCSGGGSPTTLCFDFRGSLITGSIAARLSSNSIMAALGGTSLRPSSCRYSSAVSPGLTEGSFNRTS